MPLAGVPEIAGPAVTVMENAGSEALDEPSATLITMPVYVPTFAAVGVPASWPVVPSKVAHDGFPVIEKVSAPPAASAAPGWNE